MSPGFGDLTPQAQQLVASGDLAGAQELLGAALNSADPSPANASPELVEAAGLQARVLVALGEPHSARGWAAFAYAAADRLYGPADQRTVASAATLAAVLHRVGSHERAARLYRDVIIELTATDGPESLRVLAAHADLATVEYAQGECQLARNRLEDAWELHREVYGDGHVSGIRMLARLGSMQRDCGHFTEAHEHLALARELCREHLTADHPLAIQVAALARAAANPDHTCRDGESADPDGATETGTRTGGPVDTYPSAAATYPAPADTYPAPTSPAAYPAPASPSAYPVAAEHSSTGYSAPAEHSSAVGYPAPSDASTGAGYPDPADSYAAAAQAYPIPGGSHTAPTEPPPPAVPPRMPPPRVPPPRLPVDHGPFGPGASSADTVYPPSDNRPADRDNQWWPPDRAESDPADEPVDGLDDHRAGWTSTGRAGWRTEHPADPDNDSWAREPTGTDWDHAPPGAGWDHAPPDTGWSRGTPGAGSSPLPPAVPGMAADPGGGREPSREAGGTRHLPERRPQAKVPVRIYQPPRRPLRRTLPVIVAGLVVVLLGTVAVVAGFALTSGSDPDPTGPTGPTPSGPAASTTPGAGAPPGPVAGPQVSPGAPPTALAIRDSRDSVNLSWVYPPGAEGPIVVSAGRTGQDPRAIYELAPGTTSFIVYSLNRNTDYCFTVAVVYSVDLVGRTKPVCTNRSGAS